MNISRDYKPFLEDVITLCLGRLGVELHSIYICGSIPKGTAKKNFSDADFTLVIHKELEYITETVGDIKQILLKRYNFIPKIDMLTVTVKKVLTYPYEWGFWITIISECVYGDDLKKRLPEIIPNFDLVLALNEDTNDTLDTLLEKCKESGFKDERVIKKITRRVLIALYTFIYPFEKYWVDDVKEMFLRLQVYFPRYRDYLDYSYNKYLKPIVIPEEFMDYLTHIRKIINNRLGEIQNDSRDKESNNS